MITPILTQEYRTELCEIFRKIASHSLELDFAADTRRQTMLKLNIPMDFREVRKQAEIVRLTSSELRESLRKLDDWLQKTEESTDN